MQLLTRWLDLYQLSAFLPASFSWYPEIVLNFAIHVGPAFRAHLTMRFNERAQGDLFFLWDQIWLLLIDEHIRYKVTGKLSDKS